MIIDYIIIKYIDYFLNTFAVKPISEINKFLLQHDSWLHSSFTVMVSVAITYSLLNALFNHNI